MQNESTKSYSVFMLLGFTALLMAERFLVPAQTFSLITCGVGIIALVLYFYFAELSMEKLGITSKPKQILSAVLHGVLLPVVSILVVMGVEELIWILTGHSGLYFEIGKDLYFSNIYNSSLAYTGISGFAMWGIGGLGICLVRSVFYELGFRGYFYYDAGEHFRYGSSNVIQSLAYTLMAGLPSVVVLVRAGITGNMDKMPGWVLPVMIAVTIANLMVIGLRQGDLRALTGSVWVCVICFWIFDYFNTVFHSTALYPEYLSSFVVLIRSLAVQIVASILNIPATRGYYKQMKKEMKATETRTMDIDRIAASVLREDQRRREHDDIF